MKNEVDLQRFERDLIDRFGALPTQVVDLLDSVRIKWLATTLGFEKIVLKNQKLVGFFVSDQESRFYQSKHFSKVLQYVQAHPQTCTVKEKQMRVGLRLLMSFSNINSVQQGLDALKPILL